MDQRSCGSIVLKNWQSLLARTRTTMANKVHTINAPQAQQVCHLPLQFRRPLYIALFETTAAADKRSEVVTKSQI